MKIFLMTLALATLGLTGCLSGEPDPHPNIKVADMSSVSGCKHVGNISASSRNYGVFSEAADKSRVNLAKTEAYKMGATHIVLEKPTEDDHSTFMNGQAYICP